ncbi:hypothetical protein EJ05DRAFT_482960 [Pseudovirgaria hyperparasitica]|uniref:Uncharacterized protein n=1 Tax=Pseudovirgaria hyperparasitica TaxID=470096 RepID=A0A6A6WJ25_9PEZI|nr:uncharacterized protein EJ05DRAFT_482960 [Pseudovirgaria hyperparasitica]KAF2762185.1 hypothetical protein EJ05DRAFT_482960 [Pseudovirgaria hyperparasitica]
MAACASMHAYQGRERRWLIYSSLLLWRAGSLLLRKICHRRATANDACTDNKRARREDRTGQDRTGQDKTRPASSLHNTVCARDRHLTVSQSVMVTGDGDGVVGDSGDRDSDSDGDGDSQP